MRDKLKRALEKYEKRRPIATDEELTCAVEQIIEKERSKKLRRRDSTLIDEAISFLFELRGLDTEAIDEAGEEANRAAMERAIEKVDETSRPTRLWKRFLVPVAILLSVIIATSVAIGYEVYEDPLKSFNETKELTQGITEKGLHINGNGFEVLSGKPVKVDIKTLDELTEVVEETNIYLPYSLEDDFEIRNINYNDYGEFKHLFFDLYDEYGKNHFSVETRETWQIELETKRIGNFDVNLVIYKDDNRKDVFSAGFQYGGYTYQIDAYSVWSLGKILNSLEVIKK